ncbi:MAG: hypothetical protein ACRDCV_04165 [Plesiomonas shigelloides]
MKKMCFKCGEVKSLSDFYKHKMMGDGRLNKCKECAKRDVRENRLSKIEYYRAYDIGRGSRVTDESVEKRRKEKPNAYIACGIVQRAIRSGKLHRMPCEECGSTDNVHAHHDDYLKPLNVRWLCAAHHSQWHKINGYGKNAS